MGSIANSSFAPNTSEWGGAVLKTSAGDAVIVCFDGSAELIVYKDVDGTPTQVGSAQSPATIHGTDSQIIIHACIDSNDLVHIVSAPYNPSASYTRYIAYNTCNLTTGFGTWEEAAPYVDANLSMNIARIAVDSNDDVHIAYTVCIKYKGTSYRRVYYTNNVSGWATPERVDDRGDGTMCYSHLDIEVDGSNDVHVAYNYGTIVDYRKRTSGSWGTRTSDTTGSHTDTRIIHDGTNEWIFVKLASGTIWAGQSEGMASTGYGTVSLSTMCLLDAVIHDGVVWVLYIDTSSDVHAIYYDSGWTNYGAILATTAGDICGVWQYNNGNQSASDLEMCYEAPGGTGETWLTETVAAVEVVTQLDALTISLAEQTLTVVPGLATTLLDQLNLNLAEQNLTFVPGLATTILDAVAITLGEQNLTVVPGLATILLDELAISLGEQNITIQTTTLTLLNALSLNLAEQNITVNILTTTLLDALAIDLGEQNLTVVPGLATTLLDALAIDLGEQNITIETTTITLLNALSLSMEGKKFTEFVFIDHEEGDFSDYTSYTVDSDFTVDAGAALEGTSYGLKIVINDTGFLYGYKSLATPSTTGIVRARIYIDPNNLTMAVNDEFSFFSLREGSFGTVFASLSLYYDVSSPYYKIRPRAETDIGGNGYSGASHYITDGPHWLEIEVVRASSAIASDGTSSFWIDGVLKEAATSIDNYDAFENFGMVYLMVLNLDVGTSGTLYLDEVVINDDGGVIGSHPVTKEIDHEEGDFSDYTGYTSDADFTIETGAALSNTVYGLQLVIDDTTPMFGQYQFVPDQSTGVVRARFYFDPNTLSIPASGNIDLFQLYNIDGQPLMKVFLYKDATIHYMGVGGWGDDAFFYNDIDGSVPITSECYIEIEIRRATSAVAGNGTITMWINGIEKGWVLAYDNYDMFNGLRYLRFGAIAVYSGSSGTYYLDELILNTSGDGIPLVSNLDQLAITTAGQSLSVVPGLAFTILDALTLTMAGQVLSVDTGGVISLLQALSLSTTGQSLSVIPGLATTILDQLIMTLAGQQLSVETEVETLLQALAINLAEQNLTVVPGLAAVLLNALSITMSGQLLTVITESFTLLQALSLSLNGQTLSVVPGLAYTNLNALNLATSGQTLATIPGLATVDLNQLALTMSGQTLSVVPGLAATLLNQLPITMAGQQLSVIPGLATTSLDQLAISMACQNLTTIPGLATVLLNQLAITMAGQILGVAVGNETLLQALAITMAGQQLSVVPGLATTLLDQLPITMAGQPMTISTETLTLLQALSMTMSGQQLSVITGAAILLQALNISMAGQSLSVIPGLATIPLNQLAIAMAGQQLAVVPGLATSNLDTLQISTVGNNLLVIPGATISDLAPLLLTLSLLTMTVTVPAAESEAKFKAMWRGTFKNMQNIP